MKQGFIGAALTAGWFVAAVGMPFYILWRFGMHRLAEAAGIGSLLVWLFVRGGVDPGSPSAVFLASMPMLWIGLGCLFLALLIRFGGAFGMLPSWAAGHGIPVVKD